EGQRQSSILRAEGEAQALLTLQEAQAEAVRMVFTAVNAAGATPEAMKIQYMQMLPKLAENPANKVIVVPADMAGLAGLATSISQMLPSDQSGQRTKALSSEAGGRPQLKAVDTV
ncbi:MAG: SPFH domain-containing protein, partial [Chloroflexota bacterium]